MSNGCGCTGGGKFWDVKNAVIENNWVHGNHSVGLWADTNNRGFEFKNNYISDNNDYGLIYEISYNAVIEQNTFVRNGLVSGPQHQRVPGQRDLHLGIGCGQPRAGEFRRHLPDREELLYR